MRVSLENRRPTTWMSSSVDRIGFEAAYMLTTNQFQSVRMGPWWGRIRGTWMVNGGKDFGTRGGMTIRWDKDVCLWI